jgi:hypothetical protein
MDGVTPAVRSDGGARTDGERRVRARAELRRTADGRKLSVDELHDGELGRA